MPNWTGAETWFGDDLQTAGFDDEFFTPGSTATAAITQGDESSASAVSISVKASATPAAADQTVAAVAQVAVKSVTGAHSLGLYWDPSWWSLHWWADHWWAIPSSDSTGISQTGDQTGGRWWAANWQSSTWWAAHWWGLAPSPGTHVTVSGALSEAQAADLLAVATSVSRITATLGLTEAADSLVATGEVASAPGSVTGGLSATQADQALTSAGRVAVDGDGAGTQSPDALDAIGSTGAPAFVVAGLSVTQDDNTLSAEGVAVRAQDQQSGGTVRMRSRPKPRPITASVQVSQDSNRIASRGAVLNVARDVPRTTATVVAFGASDSAGIHAATSIHAHVEAQATGDSCRAVVHLDWHDLIAAEDEAFTMLGMEGLLLEAA